MSNRHRKRIDALIAAVGELEEAKFDASLTPPLPDRRNPRFESADIHHQRFDNNRALTDTKRAVLKAAANARPALTALIARLELAEAVCESCRWEKSGWSGSDEMMYDEKALAAWRAAKEPNDDA